MAELGTQAWLDDFCARANDDFSTAIEGWDWGVGLAFLADGDRPTRHAYLDIQAGTCVGAREVDEDTFAAAPIRISGTYERWDRVLQGDLDPMRALLLRKLRLSGDLTTLLQHHDAAAALIRCACRVNTIAKGA